MKNAFLDNSCTKLGEETSPSPTLEKSKLSLSLDQQSEVSHGFTAQKMKSSIKDFSSKCDQIRSFLRIWSHLLEKSLIENFIFCAVFVFKVCPKYRETKMLTTCFFLILIFFEKRYVLLTDQISLPDYLYFL